MNEKLTSEETEEGRYSKMEAESFLPSIESKEKVLKEKCGEEG